MGSESLHRRPPSQLRSVLGGLLPPPPLLGPLSLLEHLPAVEPLGVQPVRLQPLSAKQLGAHPDPEGPRRRPPLPEAPLPLEGPPQRLHPLPLVLRRGGDGARRWSTSFLLLLLLRHLRFQSLVLRCEELSLVLLLGGRFSEGPWFSEGPGGVRGPAGVRGVLLGALYPAPLPALGFLLLPGDQDGRDNVNNAL